MTKNAKNPRFFSLDGATALQKREWYSSVSHMLRTPMVGATGYVDCLFKGYSGKLTKAQYEQLALVRDSILALNSCIDTLLDIAALDVGISCAGSAKSDIGRVLEEVSLSLNDGNCHGHPVSLSMPSCTMPVRMEKERAYTVFFELLRHAAAKGSVEICASVSGRRLYVDISCAELEKDINPYRFFVGEDRRGGLGLVLASKLIAAHRGELRVRAGGFRVSLPLLSGRAGK